MATTELVDLDISGNTMKNYTEVATVFQYALAAFGYDVPDEKIYPLMEFKKNEAIRLILDEYEENEDKITEKYIAKINQRFLELMDSFYIDTPSFGTLP